MAVTREEYIAKKQIMDKLAKEGYPTYAHLLDLFELNLTNDPNVVGYMIPDQGVIVLNRNLDIDQVSTIVRHEILHEYLSHQLRMQRHLGKDAYDKRSPTIHQLINIAGDYEISNRGYTEKDKDIVRAIKLNGQTLKGLVTEDDHPEWIDLTIEEMFDELNKQYQKDMEELQPLLDMIQKLNQQMDSDIQKAEQIEREANDISDQLDGGGSGDGEESDSDSDSKGQGNGKDSDELADKADKIAKAAKEAGDELKDQKDGDDSSKDSKSKSKSSKGSPSKEHSGNDDVFGSEEARRKQIKISKRIDAIEKAFDELKDKLESEDYRKVQQDRAIKADRELKAYKADPLHRFQASINDFIKRAIGIKKDFSWSRPNRRYAGTGILAQGKAIKPNPIPVINVYVDQSGSWGADDIAMGAKAMNVLKNYVDRGKIKVNTYYFSNNVHGDARSARNEGGTEGQPILDHIRATHPDNVVVMTDSDIGDCRTKIRVPGAVWFLWKYGQQSQNLIDHLSGEKKTEMFDLNF